MTQIIMVTNKGEINLNLFDEDAPMTVASFLFLAIHLKRSYKPYIPIFL